MKPVFADLSSRTRCSTCAISKRALQPRDKFPIQRSHLRRAADNEHDRLSESDCKRRIEHQRQLDIRQDGGLQILAAASSSARWVVFPQPRTPILLGNTSSRRRNHRTAEQQLRESSLETDHIIVLGRSGSGKHFILFPIDFHKQDGEADAGQLAGRLQKEIVRAIACNQEQGGKPFIDILPN